MNGKDYIITLDDNKEYALVDMIEYENCKYVYLVEMDDPSNYLFAEFLGNSVRTIEDKELLGKVMYEFSKKVEENNGETNS